MEREIKQYSRQVFGERLKELRNEMRISQNKLAEDLELSNASICYWETGRQEPTASALCKLAQYFSVPVDYLLGLVDY